MKHVISNFIPSGGQHCITHALKQLFAYQDCSLSEEMLFGLGEGLDFTYIHLQHSPMVSGRSKVLDFEKRLAANLGLRLIVHAPKTYEKAFLDAKKNLLKNQPLLIYTDMAYLPYFSLDEHTHFGGHAVILFGFDDEREIFYVSDRDHSDFPIRTPAGLSQQDAHLISYEDLSLARSSKHRPFPANNKSVSFDFSTYRQPGKEQVSAALKQTINNMLYPKAKLKGIRGIDKFSQQVLLWKKFDDEGLRLAGATNYFQIHKDGGTGGGIFRKMFGGFLLEAAPLLDNSQIEKNGTGFIQLAEAWNQIADSLWLLHETANRQLLSDISLLIKEAQQKERALLTQLEAIS